MPSAFAAKLPRSGKRARGRTTAPSTPIAIRSRQPISHAFQKRIRTKLARQLGHAGPVIERGTVRFEDLNGPRGGIDAECRIKLVVSGRPSVQASERASDREGAFDLAAHKVRRALDRQRGKHRVKSGQRYRGKGMNRGAAGHAAVRATTAVDKPRNIEKIKTARLPPARRAAKSRARTNKRRVTSKRR